MDRKVIQKYKKVFEHWLAGGGFWFRKPKDTEWTHNTKTAPVLKGLIYVEDDEYQEFRKAYYDGALILMRTSTIRAPRWRQLDSFSRIDITELCAIDFSEAHKYDIFGGIQKKKKYDTN